MMEIIHVSSRGQIVIPEKARKHFGIKEGSRLVLLEQEGSLILRKEEDVAKQLAGNERQETAGWLKLAEQSLKETWDNPKDEKAWKRYL